MDEEDQESEISTLLLEIGVICNVIFQHGCDYRGERTLNE